MVLFPTLSSEQIAFNYPSHSELHYGRIPIPPPHYYVIMIMFSFHFQELLRKNKVVIVDINTCVLPEDEPSLTNTKYFIHKLIDSASTKFRSYIRAHFTVIMPTIVSQSKF